MGEIRTLIVDDEPLARATIATLLRSDPTISIIGECGSGTDAIEAIGKLRPDLLFLDVQLPGCDGFDVIEQLGGNVPKGVIFVTAYDRYALKAFEVEALDYLLKPFSDARFFRVLSRAKMLLQQRAVETRSPDRLMVKSAGRVTFLDVAAIDWIEAADYYSCLHTGGRTHLLRRSMSDFERELDQKLFCRIHRSAIVNIARIQELRLDANGEHEVVLENGVQLRLSRSYREQLQKRLSAVGR
jgi:two-component system LytT family response regulator